MPASSSPPAWSSGTQVIYTTTVHAHLNDIFDLVYICDSVYLLDPANLVDYVDPIDLTDLLDFIF
jgi:hypothetical protein